MSVMITNQHYCEPSTPANCQSFTVNVGTGKPYPPPPPPPLMAVPPFHPHNGSSWYRPPAKRPPLHPAPPNILLPTRFPIGGPLRVPHPEPNGARSYPHYNSQPVHYHHGNPRCCYSPSYRPPPIMLPSPVNYPPLYNSNNPNTVALYHAETAAQVWHTNQLLPTTNPLLAPPNNGLPTPNDNGAVNTIATNLATNDSTASLYPFGPSLPPPLLTPITPTTILPLITNNQMATITTSTTTPVQGPSYSTVYLDHNYTTAMPPPLMRNDNLSSLTTDTGHRTCLDYPLTNHTKLFDKQILTPTDSVTEFDESNSIKVTDTFLQISPLSSQQRAFWLPAHVLPLSTSSTTHHDGIIPLSPPNTPPYSPLDDHRLRETEEGDHNIVLDIVDKVPLVSNYGDWSPFAHSNDGNGEYYINTNNNNNAVIEEECVADWDNDPLPSPPPLISLDDWNNPFDISCNNDTTVEQCSDNNSIVTNNNREESSNDNSPSNDIPTHSSTVNSSNDKMINSPSNDIPPLSSTVNSSNDKRINGLSNDIPPLSSTVNSSNDRRIFNSSSNKVSPLLISTVEDTFPISEVPITVIDREEDDIANAFPSMVHIVEVDSSQLAVQKAHKVDTSTDTIIMDSPISQLLIKRKRSRGDNKKKRKKTALSSYDDDNGVMVLPLISSDVLEKEGEESEISLTEEVASLLTLLTKNNHHLLMSNTINNNKVSSHSSSSEMRVSIPLDKVILSSLPSTSTSPLIVSIPLKKARKKHNTLIENGTTKRDSLDKELEKILSNSSYLSLHDMAIIKSFFLNTLPVIDKPILRYVLRKQADNTDDYYICLELNLHTKEWCGYTLKTLTDHTFDNSFPFYKL